MRKVWTILIAAPRGNAMTRLRAHVFQRIQRPVENSHVLQDLLMSKVMFAKFVLLAYSNKGGLASVPTHGFSLNFA